MWKRRPDLIAEDLTLEVAEDPAAPAQRVGAMLRAAAYDLARVPAVLRGNTIPAKVLVEMLNISNKEDAKLLASAGKRRRLARALQLSLYRYFGERPPTAAAATAAP